MTSKLLGKYKGWTIHRITSGKAKGLYYASKGDVSFGILGANTLPSIKEDIDRRHISRRKMRRVS